MYTVWQGNMVRSIWSKSYEKYIFCGQSLVLAHLFAFFQADVEFCQVIFNVIAFSGLTYENNEASWSILCTCPVVQLIFSVVQYTI